MFSAKQTGVMLPLLLLLFPGSLAQRFFSFQPTFESNKCVEEETSGIMQASHPLGPGEQVEPAGCWTGTSFCATKQEGMGDIQG